MDDSLTAAPRPAGDPLALRRHMEAIADLGRKALSGVDPDTLFGEICELVASALDIERVALIEDLGDQLLLRAWTGWHDIADSQRLMPRTQSSQANYTLETGEIVVVAEAKSEDRFQVSERIVQAGVVSGISVPIPSPSGRPFGVLTAHASRRRHYREDERVFLRLVANVVGAAVEAARAEEASRNRQHLLSTLVEHGPDIVLRFDRELRHMYVSPAIEVATGRAPESYVGKTPAEAGFPPHLVELWAREFGSVFETGRPGRFEFEFEDRWFESHAVAEPDENGGVASIVVFTRDRTEARNADARYRELFELATDMIMLVGADGALLDVNPAAELGLGYSRSELIGRQFNVVMADDHLAAAETRIARTLDGTEISAVYESALRARSGRVIPIQVSSRVVVRDGRPAGVLAIARDISDQKAAQAALQASERLFRSAFEDAAVGMLLTTPGEEIVRANPAYARMLGYENPDELRGRSIAELLHPDERTVPPDVIAAIVSGEQGAYRGEKRYVARDGSIVWCQIGLSAVRAADGSVPYLVAQVENVTELRRVQNELRESQKLHQLVVESSRDLITVFDLDLNVRLISRSVADMLGYAIEEVEGSSLAAFVPVDDMPIAQAALGAALRGEESELSQVRVRGKDGSFRVLEFKASAGFDATGEAAFVVTISRDVTDRMWLEEQLRQSQKMEAIGKLAGGVAHDFNNLLTAINGYSDVALAALPAGADEARRSLEEIRRAGERAAELTHQLLAFSRRQVLRPEAVDLSEVVQGYLTMLERLVGEDVALRTSLDPDIPAVQADPGQLGQVLLNLVVNARDAMPDGGDLLITTAAEGTQVTLTVADTGHGMEAETMRRAFEPFYTTKEPGKGTGMGLSTVHGIVEQSGGAISVESEPGRGATFRVSLPAATEAPRGVEAPPASEPPARAATVLLVEDEPLVRGIVQEMLVALGHRVLPAAGPAEALATVAAGEQFDLVLTDVVMPEMNGHELASRLSVLRPGVRIVYTSGYTGEAVEARGVLGARDWFLQKPFTMDALAAKLRTALAARAS